MKIQTAGGGFLAHCDSCDHEVWATTRSVAEQRSAAHKCRGGK